MTLDKLVEILHEGGYSCVVSNGAEVRTFIQRGIADLYGLLKNEPAFLNGASVADKVVGKGAAALMVLGGVRELYTDVISTPALQVLEKAGIDVGYGTETTAIRNRDNTGICPVEMLCAAADSPTEMLFLIDEFINSKK